MCVRIYTTGGAEAVSQTMPLQSLQQQLDSLSLGHNSISSGFTSSSKEGSAGVAEQAAATQQEQRVPWPNTAAQLSSCAADQPLEQLLHNLKLGGTQASTGMFCRSSSQKAMAACTMSRQPGPLYTWCLHILSACTLWLG